MPRSRAYSTLVAAAVIGLFGSALPASPESARGPIDAVNADGSLSQAFLDEVAHQDEAQRLDAYTVLCQGREYLYSRGVGGVVAPPRKVQYVRVLEVDVSSGAHRLTNRGDESFSPLALFNPVQGRFQPESLARGGRWTSSAPAQYEVGEYKEDPFRWLLYREVRLSDLFAAVDTTVSGPASEEVVEGDRCVALAIDDETRVRVNVERGCRIEEISSYTANHQHTRTKIDLVYSERLEFWYPYRVTSWRHMVAGPGGKLGTPLQEEVIEFSELVPTVSGPLFASEPRRTKGDDDPAMIGPYAFFLHVVEGHLTGPLGHARQSLRVVDTSSVRAPGPLRIRRRGH